MIESNKAHNREFGPVVPVRSEEELQNLLDLLPDPAVCLKGGYIRSANARALKLWGGSRQALIGLPSLRIIRPYCDTISCPGSPNTAKVIRHDGSIAEADISETPILLQREPATLLLMRDAGDRKRLQNELYRIKNWLDIVLASMSDGLSVFDNQYRWICMNKADELRIRDSGRDPSSLLGKVVWDEVPDLSQSRFGHKLREVMQQRVSTSFEESCGTDRFEIYLSPTEDGGVAAISRLHAERQEPESEASRRQEENQSLERNVTERITGLARTIRELRNQHEHAERAERAVYTERRRLERLMELLPMGVMLLSPQHEVVFENKFFRERFGEPDSRYCYEILFGRSAPCEGCKGMEILRNKTTAYWDMVDKDAHSYNFYAFPFSEIDQSPIILVIGVDVTDRKQVQQQLENANRQLATRAEQLRALMIELSRTEDRERRSLAQILHDELQQLLVAIKFGAEFLHHKIAEPDQKAEAKRIVDLVAQSIGVTRSLTTQLSPPVLHEAGLAEGLGWLSRWMNERHGLEVSVSVQERTPSLPEEMRVMLFQAVRELLFNVVKHAGTTKAAVEVTHENAKALRIRVLDAGSGFVVTGAMGTGPGGFGLFSIRERLVMLGGNMEIESRPGNGTIVTLTVDIPAEEPPKAQPARSTTEIVPEASITEPGMARVLVVDDHTVLREGLVEILQKQPGMVIVGEAIDGQEAVQRARELHPTTVLMDVTLPKMSGIEATRIITREMPEVRVIALSMHSREDFASRMREAGASRYMLKDCPVKELVTAIYETMNVKTQHIM